MHTTRYFISYAHHDRAVAERLLGLLRPRLKIATGINLQAWSDHLIPLGEQWSTHITTALETADFGLLLLSPEFFASEFITTQELSHFITPQGAHAAVLHKPIAPIGLKPVPLDGGADLSGVQHTQIFRDHAQRWFSQTSGTTSDAFADQLVEALRYKLMGTGSCNA